MRALSRTRLLFALAAVLCPAAVSAAELPTADAILQIHRRNRQQLSRLHLQLVHRYETTEAACRQAQKEADQKEMILEHVSKSKPEDLGLTVNGKPVKGEEARRLIELLGGAEQRQDIKNLRSLTKPFSTVRHMEFFFNGDDYQYRQPMWSLKTGAERQEWTFTDTPLTADTLLTAYREMSIYSRSAKLDPPARWWHNSLDRHAYIMRKHLTEVMGLALPPYTDVTRPDWGRRHPIDAFFSQPAEKYRVVRQEEMDGRLLTVVDVTVPIHPDSQTLLSYRGWLDLTRGALPLRMYHAQSTAAAPANMWDIRQPSEIITTHTVSELPGGGFYPAKTVSEGWQLDPDAPEPTAEEAAEIRTGQRKIPVVVHHRNTWECALVEIQTDYDADFFVIPFPEDQKIFDHDAGKMLGELDSKPLVKVGQKAPPLSIAHWLDGQQRTWDDLRGQVVVLDFWGLSCGACRSAVPRLNAIQKRFHDQPVTFISIHHADKDPQVLARRIEEFQKNSGWQYLAAIDKGRMSEDSVTSNAYGVPSLPLMVIVGPDGKVVYVDPQIDGPACSEEDPELLADFEQKVNVLMKDRFEAVGETWPIPKNLDDKQQEAILSRVEELFIARQIKTALKSSKRLR